CCFIGFTIRINRSLRFMSFSRFHLFFKLIGILKRKIGFVGFLIQSDITLVRLTLLVCQATDVNSLTVFELIILLIIQFLTSKSSRNFLRIILLIILSVALRLLIGIASIEQKFNIAFVCIELNR